LHKCIYSDYLKAIITIGFFNRWGTTPLDEAKKNGDTDIINILQSS
jgi:ankyrin repeat protein